MEYIPCGSSQNIHIERAKSLIDEIKSYEKDWNGEGAEKISIKVIDESLNFLHKLDSLYSGIDFFNIAASPDGEIVIYWHNSQDHIAINFYDDDSVSLCWSVNNSEMDIIEEDVNKFNQSDKSLIWNKFKDLKKNSLF